MSLHGTKVRPTNLDILLRFHSYQVALTANTEKVFLMISVAERDRDVLRFLWVDDVTKDHLEICALRFARVVFGVLSSPFLLNATIKHHLELSSSLVNLVQNLLRSTYVDDIVTREDSEDLAYHLYIQAKDLLHREGFNLRKFITNSPQLQQRITRELWSLRPARRALVILMDVCGNHYRRHPEGRSWRTQDPCSALGTHQ